MNLVFLSGFFFSMHVISDKFSSRGDGVISSVNVELKI